MAAASTSLLFLALLVLGFTGCHSARFTLENRCRDTIWPGIQGQRGEIPPMNGGFRLNPGEAFVFEVSAVWTAGRIWARTGCTFDPAGSSGTCVTGDCGGRLQCGGIGGKPPVSLAEFTLGRAPGDFYDVSLVDGFNVPVAIIPAGGSGNCSAVSCTADLNQLCPEELRVRDGSGRVQACKSACIAFGDDRYCCAGEYSSPQRCGPSSYSQVFKRACPSAYSYAFDDTTSTFTCSGAHYTIVFC